MTEPIVSVASLSFHYPTKTALDTVSFQIPKGEITALVGPNGAGKSTLMRCMAGLDTPFAGGITVAGTDVLENPREAHAKIGYLSDSFGLYDDLTVTEILTYMAGCHMLPDIAARVEWVILILRLGSVKDQKCATLSRGWRQRVGIGMSIIHKPEILILDEPASGLDPEARAELSSVLKHLRDDGMNIMVSSHILAELEEYCTAMLVIRDGKIRDHVTLAQHQETATTTLQITFASDLGTAQEASLKSKYATIELPDRRHAVLSAPATAEAQHQILKDLIALNLPVSGFTAETKKLQTLYLETAQTRT